MKFLFLLMVTLITFQISLGFNMICYYNTVSANRVDLLKFTSKDLELALKYCTHVVYDHASFNPKTFIVNTVTSQREQELDNMKKFKRKYPNVRFLLSISGDKRVRTTKDYIHLLEAGEFAQESFVKSAVEMVHKYRFDGLSLDFHLPTEKPIENLSKCGQIWNKIKKLFYKYTDGEIKIEHRQQLTDLIEKLSIRLKDDNLMLTLNVPPNTNSKVFDIPTITTSLNFIILSAFDFSTPERNPHEADYMAPIKPLDLLGHRLFHANVKTLVHEWHHQQVPRNKIIVGVATWGRTWTMTKCSQNYGAPPVLFTDGPAPGGLQTRTPGFLSWPEICPLFTSCSFETKKEKVAPLKRVVDPNNQNGNYAFRPADENGKNGIWISYEDPETAAAKAQYVRDHNLGGVALFDLGLDDFHGLCTDDRYPMLRSIRSKLLEWRND